MPQQDNAVAVTQRLIAHYKLPITEQSIEEVLKSHHDYPSLKSICDALNEWKVTNYPVRLNREELRETEAPFIAHLHEGGGNLVFVPELNGNAKVKYFDSNGKSKIACEEDFFKKYSGVSLLIDPDEKAGETEYKEKKQNELLHHALPWIVGLSLALFAAYAFLANERQEQLTVKYFALVFTKITGLFLSVMLVLKDLNIKIGLADSLCGVSKKTNCNSILHTAAAKVFGWIHWSDVGLIYFLSGLFILIGIPTIGEFSLMAIVSFGALAYVVYSIHHQAFVAKSWCQLCLGIQAVFIAEAALFYTYLFPFELSWISILKYAIIGLFILIVVALYKIYRLNKKTSQQERLAFQKFKKNPIIFVSLLQQGEQKNFNFLKEIFVVGQPEAPVEVTAFLSLNCNPCQKAFNQLKLLFENDKIKTNLIFSLHDKDRSFVNQVAQLFVEKKQKEASELLDAWYNSKGDKRNSLIKQAEVLTPDDSFELIKKAHRELFTADEITGTPTVFVNGYRLPREYQIKDISDFTNVLKK